MIESIPLPNQDTPAEFAGIYYVLAKEFGYQFYDRVSKAISKKAGSNFDWFTLINDERDSKNLPKYLDAKDPRFLLSEAAYYNSPVRLSMEEIDGNWLTEASKLRALLNLWSHHQIQPKPGTFLDLLYPMREISLASELDLVSRVDELIDRTRQIKDMVWIPNGESIEVPKDAKDYAKEVEVKIAKIKRRPPVGSPWIGEPGARRVKLSKALRDITDQGKSIKNELKPDPEEKIKEFLRIYPNGGDLRIDDDGAVLGYVKGDPILVGWLGEEPDVKSDEIRGFIDPRDYIFLGNDIKDAATGQLLSEVATEPIDALLNGLNAWGGLKSGDVIHTTEYSDILFETESGELRKITKSHPGIWFPQEDKGAL